MFRVGSPSISLVVNTAPSLDTPNLKVGATLASCAVAGSYTWPGGPVSESWSFTVDDVAVATNYVIDVGDKIVVASVTLSATGLGSGYVLPVGPYIVQNSAPTAGDVSPTVTVVAGTATAPLQMAAPTLTSTATRITITKAADPANGGSAITGYDFRYSTDGGTNWSTPAALTSPQTVSGFTPGATGMLVQERANNAIGNGAWSTSASVNMNNITFVGYFRLGGTGATITLDFTGGIQTDTGGIGGAILQNDVIFVANGWATSATDQNPGVSTSGYTEIDDLFITNTRAANLSLDWKAMGSTPDTSVDANGPNAAGNGGVAIALVYRYVDPTNPLDVAYVTANHSAKGSGNALADPPSITPVSTGAAVLTVVGATGDTTPASINAPSGPTTRAGQTNGGSSRGFRIGCADIAWTSGAYDQAAWTTSESAASDSWIAMAIALKPW